MLDLTTSYFAIEKADKNSDGTLLVYGKATDDTLDIDQQICDSLWLSKAMPEWFRTGGNIREQHSNIAAGVAKEYEEKSDGHYISALVVDPLSVKKVETGVLKGFSIGIKSPRVIRDTKAANGRIVDGQIVEVSLVDRPANPNAKLTLAKSVDGEANLIKVEELVEQTEKGSRMEQIKQIAEIAKSLTADKVKFDQAAFDSARRALAELIVVEANEMANLGSNEKDSIEELLDAVKHLFNWYEGEAMEGETPAQEPALELANNPEIVKEEIGSAGCDCEGCKACKAQGGCDDKMCKMCKGAHKEADSDEEDANDTEEKSANKCLECGCHKPQDSHGVSEIGNESLGTVSNVSTAQMVSPDQTPKSAEVSDVNASDKTLVDDDIKTIIEKAVQSATESVKAEIDALKAAKEAEVEKSIKLEQELAIAKSSALAGGPKRTAVSQGTESNNSEIQAAAYRLKAMATTDPVLAKGYREMAEEILSKATKSQDDSDKE